VNNPDVARAFLRAIEAGDVPSLDALLDPAFHWWVAAYGERTRAAFLEGVTRTVRSFEQRQVMVTGITAEGERVAVEAEGRFERPGLVYRNSYHYLFIVRDGRIVSGKEYFDTAAAAAAFGPPPRDAGPKT
jgi:ketosteroid isomerase-like protein